MYARSTTFHGKPGNIDAGIKFVINEVAPMLDSIEGCRGVSFLVDRETGQSVATSSWDTDAAMRGSDDQLRPIRDRGRDVLGGSMQVDEWEIAVMHRTQHGACCRVSWLQGDLDTLGETFKVALLPRLDETPGFCGASLMIDRDARVGCSTTVWESREAMEASRSAADELRVRAASDSGGEIVDVLEFDLAYAHLHVPELV